MVSQAENNSKGYHSLVPGLISNFLEMVWVPSTGYICLTQLRLTVSERQGKHVFAQECFYL